MVTKKKITKKWEPTYNVNNFFSFTLNVIDVRDKGSSWSCVANVGLEMKMLFEVSDNPAEPPAGLMPAGVHVPL